MVSEWSGGGEHDDRMQRPEDEPRIVWSESKGMMDNTTETMATMMRSQRQEKQKESGGAEENATVKAHPNGASPASGARNPREVDVRPNLGAKVGVRVRALPEEAGPERQPGASGQDRGADPAGESTPSETSQNLRHVFGNVNNTAKYPVPMFDHTTRTISCLLYTSPSPRDGLLSRMPSSA